ncbi:MAG: cell surface protein, partial [Planctomycetaceae bacterium]
MRLPMTSSLAPPMLARPVGLGCAAILMLIAAIVPEAPAEDAPPSFELDILPILSKRGCNGGGCHGALAGKGGFRLSLFGYDPASDHLAITRDARGRRIDLAEPGASLLLTKPTTAVRHTGGRRLDVGSDDARLLAA